MNYAVLYNTFACWMVALISWAATRALFKHAHLNFAWRSLAWSWNFAAMLWFFAGWRLLWYFLFLATENPLFYQLDRWFFLFDEFCLAAQVVCINAFVGEVLGLRRIHTYWLIGLSAVGVLVFLALLLATGISETVHTTWASEHELSRPAFLAFLPVYALSIFLLVCAILADVWTRWRGVDPVDRAVLPALLALLLYGVTGILDVRGTWGGWHLLLIRLMYLVAALVTFWLAQPVNTSFRLVRHRRIT
jgi:hypothetical protein